MRSADRQLRLELVDPKGPSGLVDPQVFAGNNKLRVIMDERTLHWSFKYDRGIVPPQLKGHFTSFQLALKQAETYFKTRNIRITEIID